MSVYFIANESNQVKIGKSHNPYNRLKGFQSGSAEKLTLIKIIPGDLREEKIYHDRFQQYRIRSEGGGNEWFRIEGSLKEFIENSKDSFHNENDDSFNILSKEDQRIALQAAIDLLVKGDTKETSRRRCEKQKQKERTDQELWLNEFKKSIDQHINIKNKDSKDDKLPLVILSQEDHKTLNKLEVFPYPNPSFPEKKEKLAKTEIDEIFGEILAGVVVLLLWIVGIVGCVCFASFLAVR